MERPHLDQLITLEDHYWWHVGKRAFVTRLLRRHAPPPGRLVEGGLGAGGNLRAMRALGYAVQGFDIMPDAIAHCRARGLPEVAVHDLEQPWPVEAGTLRAVLLLDVIEHLAEPVAALAHARRALAADGAVIVAVPAYPWMYGPWDRLLGHHRRYTRSALRDQARAAGLRVAWLSHWNAFTLPVAIVLRLRERVRPRRQHAEFPPVAPVVNHLLRAAAAVERTISRIVPIPFGLSLVAVLVPDDASTDGAAP
ncbi:MAG: methyltransferase domain-containing protein [Acidobacteriota bacterium]